MSTAAVRRGFVRRSRGLVAKRPDLPFGWLLSLAAMSLAVMAAVAEPARWSLLNGPGDELAAWGLAFGSLAFVATALQGLINVRFPSGRPTGRAGWILDRLLVGGIVVALVGGFLGDGVDRALAPSATRAIDGTPIEAMGNVLGLAVPLVIALGLIAGLGVVVRCLRATGLERKQLSWRAAGVCYALLLFPFAVTQTLRTGPPTSTR